MKYYKIRNKKTGLFKSGGYYGKWTPAGKMWKASAIRNAMQMYYQYPSTTLDIKEWEVVECECKVEEVAVFDFDSFFKKKHV